MSDTIHLEDVNLDLWMWTTIGGDVVLYNTDESFTLRMNQIQVQRLIDQLIWGKKIAIEKQREHATKEFENGPPKD